jgi:hypothetical protein
LDDTNGNGGNVDVDTFLLLLFNETFCVIIDFIFNKHFEETDGRFFSLLGVNTGIFDIIKRFFIYEEKQTKKNNTFESTVRLKDRQMNDDNLDHYL